MTAEGGMDVLLIFTIYSYFQGSFGTSTNFRTYKGLPHASLTNLLVSSKRFGFTIEGDAGITVRREIFIVVINASFSMPAIVRPPLDPISLHSMRSNVHRGQAHNWTQVTRHYHSYIRVLCLTWTCSGTVTTSSLSGDIIISIFVGDRTGGSGVASRNLTVVASTAPPSGWESFDDGCRILVPTPPQPTRHPFPTLRRFERGAGNPPLTSRLAIHLHCLVPRRFPNLIAASGERIPTCLPQTLANDSPASPKLGLETQPS